MHELSNAESVTCSQEKLQYLLVELTSILDILVELSEDHDDFSFNKIYSKQKFLVTQFRHNILCYRNTV